MIAGKKIYIHTVIKYIYMCDYIGVAPITKSGTANIVLSEGVISRNFLRYMHKDKLLCIFSQIKNNAYLPVHLVHAPSFTLLLFCVFSFSFCMLFVISVSVFFASSLSLDFPIFRF
jgi:hypothetical protein